MTLATGTIILAVKRPDFVVLAADQLWHAPSDPSLFGTHRKIVIHPKLPLALATSGYAFLPAGGPSTTWHLEHVASRVRRAAQLSAGTLGGRLQTYLHPLVRQARQDPTGPTLEGVRKVTVYMGFFRGVESVLARLQVAEDCMLQRDVAFLSIPPGLMESYRSGGGLRGVNVFGDGIAEREELGRHLRAIVRSMIADETSLNGGVNLECGGCVDVALVEAKGARFLEG